MRGRDDVLLTAGTPDAELVDRLRAQALEGCRADADRLVLIAALDARVRARALAELADRPEAVRRLADDCHPDLLRGEVQVALGITDPAAGNLVHLAQRAVKALPRLAAALRSGMLDLGRVRAVVDGTDHLDDDTARVVVDRLMDKLVAEQVAAPWDGPSPRAWKQRIATAVVRADPEAANRRVQERLRQRCVRTWSNRDGTGTFQAEGPAADIIDIEQVVQSLALAWPSTDGDGTPLTMDQRRWHATVEVFRRIATNAPLPGVGVRREREVGVVLHADTLFGDGPAADEPGELRGLGAPVVLDPASARDHAEHDLARGRCTAVLLAGAPGALERLVRLHTPRTGWTRQTLIDAVRAVLAKLPPLQVPGYTPSTAIADHVRAARPRCSGYDCARAARRCDLDHDDPYPRGPTATWNLDPKCRQHHLHKTLRLWRSHLHPDGTVTWTTLLGTTIRTAHEPLPGTECYRREAGRSAA